VIAMNPFVAVIPNVIIEAFNPNRSAGSVLAETYT
jgi:hypothetical protein